MAERYAAEYAFRLQAGFSFMLPGFSVDFSVAFSIGFSMVFLQPFHGADSFFVSLSTLRDSVIF